MPRRSETADAAGLGEIDRVVKASEGDFARPAATIRNTFAQCWVPSVSGTCVPRDPSRPALDPVGGFAGGRLCRAVWVGHGTLRVLGDPGTQPLRATPSARTSSKRGVVPVGDVDRLDRNAALIDLRGDGPVRIGAPSAVAHDDNHAAGRALSAAVHAGFPAPPRPGIQMAGERGSFGAGRTKALALR